MMKILIVDDSFDTFAFYEPSLSDEFSLARCATVSEAGDHLQRHHFDVILCDLNVEDSRGVETFEQLQRMAPGTPIVVMGGSDDHPVAVEVVKAGAQDYLVKPGLINNSGWLSSLRYAIERHHLLRELQVSSEREQYLAYHDGLTGLPNRQLFQDRLRNASLQATRYGRYMAVLFIDLDQFKPVNDRFGHRCGDRVLREIAERLGHCVRESDTVARFGGDEFAIILSQISQKENAAGTTEKIIRVLEKPFDVGQCKIVISATIGISVFPEDSTDIEEIPDYADLAIYRARCKGTGYGYLQ